MKSNCFNTQTVRFLFLLSLSLIVIQPVLASAVTPKNKWLDIPRKKCIENKGKLDKDGFCHADWHNATSICKSIGGRLPTIIELRSVVTECGGEMENPSHNANSLHYQLCYRTKGFVGSNIYWSSTESYSSMWVVKFIIGTEFTRDKSKIRWKDNSNTSYVRCIHDEF